MLMLWYDIKNKVKFKNKKNILRMYLKKKNLHKKQRINIFTYNE